MVQYKPIAASAVIPSGLLLQTLSLIHFLTREFVVHLKYFGALGSCAVLATAFAFVADSAADIQDKYTLKVPGGLAFAEFKGYEGWQVISVSHSEALLAVILGNPAMIDAFQAGIPDNGRPFPDGAKMAKIHWEPKQSERAPGPTTVPGALHDVDFMVKDAKRFADGGGWGYAAFRFDATSATFKPGNATDTPPQAHDARCGAACHTIAKARDYVFTEYGTR